MIKKTVSLFLIITIALSTVLVAVNPRKKLNSINCAKILAQRNIVETVYGIKLRFNEEVNNMIDGSFEGSTETKTGKRKIIGIEFEPVKYDPDKDIAMVTAKLKLSRLADIVDVENFNISENPDKEIVRVAFATSTPENGPKLSAIRAAEIDAYKNLYKKIGGFTLQSHSKVENFILKSDKVKASVIGALMGAEFMGFKWEGEGKDAIATVKIRINVKELSKMLGQKIIDYDKEYLEAEGYAAIRNENDKIDTEEPVKKEKKSTIETVIIEEDMDVMP